MTLDERMFNALDGARRAGWAKYYEQERLTSDYEGVLAKVVKMAAYNAVMEWDDEANDSKMVEPPGLALATAEAFLINLARCGVSVEWAVDEIASMVDWDDYNWLFTAALRLYREDNPKQ